MMIKSTPVVSIIMAAYNAEKTVRQSVESILAQTYGGFELLIVDDCSTDSTLSIAEEFAATDSRVKVLRNETNRGIFETRNRALKEASGEWIAICDSDDLWLSEKLERQLETARSTDSRLIYTASSFIDQNGVPLKYIMHVPKETTFRKLLRQNIISNSSVLVKKDLYEAGQPSGIRRGIDPDDIHEDFACWLSILRNGNTAAGIDEPLLVYRVSASSRTGNKLKSAVRTWKTYRYSGLSFIRSTAAFCAYALNSLAKYRSIRSDR